MNFQSVITPNITIADQPTEADLAELKSHGYQGVVNLRTSGEPDQPLNPDAEGKLAEELGLDYLHVGVGGNGLNPDDLTRFVKFLEDRHDSKVLVHCRKGGRAAALVLIQQIRVNGWSAQEAFDKGAKLGLNVDGGLRAMVERFMA